MNHYNGNRTYVPRHADIDTDLSLLICSKKLSIDFYNDTLKSIGEFRK